MLDLSKSQQLWFQGYPNIKRQKTIDVVYKYPCLSRKAIEILQQQWQRTTNWNPLRWISQSPNNFGKLSCLVLRISKYQKTENYWCCPWMSLRFLILQSHRTFTTMMTKNNQLKSTYLLCWISQSLNNFGKLGFKNIQISKDRKLLMLSINVPEWVCLCLSRKAIEILRQRWRRTSNWKVCTLWHQHRGCANLKTFLSLSFLHLNFQSYINWFLYR